MLQVLLQQKADQHILPLPLHKHKLCLRITDVPETESVGVSHGGLYHQDVHEAEDNLSD